MTPIRRSEREVSLCCRALWCIEAPSPFFLFGEKDQPERAVGRRGGRSKGKRKAEIESESEREVKLYHLSLQLTSVWQGV